MSRCRNARTCDKPDANLDNVTAAEVQVKWRVIVVILSLLQDLVEDLSTGTYGIETSHFHASTCTSLLFFDITGEPEDQIHLFVYTLKGKRISITIPTVEDTVDLIKRQIQDKEGTPPDQMQLVFSGRHLEENRTLNDYNITMNSTLFCVLMDTPSVNTSL